METTFEKNTFGKRLKSMLSVDMRRMFTMPLIYILIGSCLVIPILILVMTTMMDGSVTTDPQTGAETVMEGFENTWQIIGSVSGDSASTDMSAGGGMSMMSMCNINLLYFFVAALVCLFVSDDFRSGYAKNLFTVRANKSDYVISKTVVCFIGGALMIIAFFIGAMLGGAISGLSFELGDVKVYEVIMCLISKILLMGVFVSIYLAVSVAAKQRAWLSILASLCVSMLLFMMIPMLTPLNSNILNVVLCLAGAVLFGVGIGAISNLVLRKTSLV